MAADKGLNERRLALEENRVNTNYGLRTQAIDAADKQAKYGSLIAAVGVPINAYFGYKEMMADKAEAAENKELRKKLLERIK